MNRFLTAFGGLTESWVTASKTFESPLIAANVVSYALLLSFVYFIGIILLAVLLIVLFSIAILFITQGTANINLTKSIKKEKLDLVEAKIKSKKLFLISLIVIRICSLLFLKPFYDTWKELRFGFVLGFPAEYMYFLDGRMTDYSFYGFSINLLFSLLVTYGISWIYYRFILGFKKF